MAAVLAMVVGPWLAGQARADALAGKTLYLNGTASVAACAACHGTNVASNMNKILRGANNAALITSAINSNVGGMGIYKTTLTATNISDIAAYIANPSVSGAPTASASPTSLAFSATTVGTASAASSVTLSNTGTAALTFGTFTFSGTQSGSYSVNTAGSTCVAGGSVAAGSSCQISVVFTPTVAGTNSATLVVAHNASGGSTSVTLSGTGNAAAVPTLSLSAATLDMGSAVAGSPSTATSRTVTVGNTGQASLNLTALTLSGTNPASFTRAGTCATTAAVAAGGSCTLVMGFSPTTVGSHSATLTLQSNASNGTQTLALTGTATATPTAVASRSPATLTYGSVPLNSTATRTVVLSNTGNAAMTISATTLTGPATFSLNTAAAGACGTTLAVGASCNLVVNYTPTLAGAGSATLSIASTGSSAPLAVAISGTGVSTATGVPALSDAAAIVFADTSTGQTSAVHTTTLSNSGSAPFTLATLALGGTQAVDFRLGGTCAVGASVAAGGSCTVTTALAPVEPGTPLSATLDLTTSTGAAFTLALSGNAVSVGGPVLALAPVSVAFGTVAVGQTSAAQRLTLSNTGTQEATVTAFTPSAAVFAVQAASASGDCAALPFVLLPGQSCAVAVVYAPTAAVTHTATLTAVGSPPALASATAVQAQATLGGTGSGGTSSTDAGGGGCTSSTDGQDASLVALLLAALGVAVWRHKAGLTRVSGKVAALLALIAWVSLIGTSARAVEIGAAAPAVDLAGQSGRINLEQYRGKTVWLDFWASWCGPCKQSFPWMNAMQDQYGPKGLQVVAVNVDARTADAQRFLGDNPARFAVAFDPAGATPRSYQIKGMPTSVLIGPDGRVLKVHNGFREADQAELEQLIRQAVGAQR